MKKPFSDVIILSRVMASPVGSAALAADPEAQVSSSPGKTLFASPFPIEVSFWPGPQGHEVGLSNLSFEYKEARGIDIPDYLREFISDAVINLEEPRLPKSQPPVEIQIADAADNINHRYFMMTIKSPQGFP